uniref:WD_REPEATS_REGION domain-containing protein n=1 Tax=Setaria digitata TaxID=48799 RepID=A0A915PNN8_9BILA
MSKMFKLGHEILISTGSASHSPNNLSVFFHEAKDLTLACVIHKNQIGTLSWDQSLNSFTYDNLPIRVGDSDAPVTVLQAKYCMPVCRTFPVLTSGQARREQTYRFTKGITYVENLIAVGSHSGELLVFSCSGENSVAFKKSVQEHEFAIVDVATCHFDDLTCSCDVSGNITVWVKNFRIIIGTLTGQLLFYSTLNGQLMAEVNAHVRQINAIAVAPESAYIISVSDDTMIRLWKLHTRKPEAYRVEWRYNERVENMPLVGAQFVNGRGSGFVVAAYDYSKLLYYQITKKS